MQKFYWEKGLTKEQVDFVLEEAGKEVNAVIAERDGYKSQLDTAQAALESMKGVDVNGLQTQIADLTTKLKGKDSEIDKIRSDYAFDALLKDAIRAASGRSEKAIMALLDMDALKASRNQAEDIRTALDSLKKENDYLFQDKTIPRVVSSTPGISQDAQTLKDKANEALRSLFGKE